MLKKPFKEIAIAIAATLLISGCASEVAVEKPLSELATYENQKLDWSTCYKDFE